MPSFVSRGYTSSKAALFQNHFLAMNWLKSFLTMCAVSLFLDIMVQSNLLFLSSLWTNPLFLSSLWTKKIKKFLKIPEPVYWQILCCQKNINSLFESKFSSNILPDFIFASSRWLFDIANYYLISKGRKYLEKTCKDFSSLVLLHIIITCITVYLSNSVYFLCFFVATYGFKCLCG